MAKQKERKLTRQELLRKEAFDRECARLNSEGYEREDLTMGIVAANILALVIMAPFAAAVFALFRYSNGGVCFSLAAADLLWFCLGMLLLLVAHEGIHGLVWGACCKNHFKSIQFGVIWSALTPYCCCGEPLKKYQYVIGAAMPTVVVGFLPAILASLAGSPLLLALGLFMIFGGGGDALIICKLLMHKAGNCEVIYIDHPYELGVVAFKKPN